MWAWHHSKMWAWHHSTFFLLGTTLLNVITMPPPPPLNIIDITYEIFNLHSLIQY